jgi:hypothetical protein
MSFILNVIDPENRKITFMQRDEFGKYFRDDDKYGAINTSFHHSACMNIYQTKDLRYYHIHGMYLILGVRD